MEKKNIQEYILNKLARSCDDNLERAERAFRGLTKHQMELEHGVSGKSRQSILDGYREERRRHDEAMTYLKECFGNVS